MFKLHKLLILNNNLRNNKANGKCKFKINCLFSVVYLNMTFYEFIKNNQAFVSIFKSHFHMIKFLHSNPRKYFIL